jgi:hypothetical protein
MTRDLLVLPLVGLLSALAGCGGGSSGGPILLKDQNNYSSTGSLSIPTVETAAATDIDICWSNVVDDIQCHAVAPLTDLNTLSLLRLKNMTEEQVEARLSSGELEQREVNGYIEYRMNGTSTCAKLSQLSFFNTIITVEQEYLDNLNQQYLLLFATGTRSGVGARTMMFIKPNPASTVTSVEAPKGCGMLTFTANLMSLTKVKMPADPPWEIDWRELTRNGLGNSVLGTPIDSVMIGFYEGMSVADIQADFFDLELNATALWDVILKSGRTADLSKAVERGTNAPFTGFQRSAPGVWLLALMCSTCQNPAPVFLTVLDLAGGG